MVIAVFCGFMLYKSFFVNLWGILPYSTWHTEKLCLGKHLEMILVTIDNEIHTAIFHLLHSICLCGLVVRIAVSHPGDPGSIPGGEIFWLVFTFYQTLRPFFGLGRTWANKRPFPPKTRGPRVPLGTEFVHGLSRPLGEN